MKTTNAITSTNASEVSKANSVSKVVIPNPDAAIEDKIELIKRVCAPNATNAELELFCYTAKKYNLDPLLNEIWLIKSDNRTLIKIARDGYLKIAHASGQFDGMASHIVSDEKGNTVKVICEVYRKDMKHPFRYEALMKEFYNPKSPAWSKSPTAMLIKVAESHALKRAFKISGVVGEEFDVSEAIEERKEAAAQDAQYTQDAQATQAVAIETVNAQATNSTAESESKTDDDELATEKELSDLRSLFGLLPIHRREKAMKLLEHPEFLTKEDVKKYKKFCLDQFITQEQFEEIIKAANYGNNGNKHIKLENYLIDKYGITEIDHITKDIFDDVMSFLKHCDYKD